jgi:hypothetical protein
MNNTKCKNANSQRMEVFYYLNTSIPCQDFATLLQSPYSYRKKKNVQGFKSFLSLLFMKLKFEKHLSYLMMPISSMAIDNSMNYNLSYTQHERNRLLAKLHQSLMEGLR